MDQRFILTQVDRAVDLSRFNRPDTRNALCSDLITEFRYVLDEFESNEEVGAIVLMGYAPAFARLRFGEHSRRRTAGRRSYVAESNFFGESWREDCRGEHYSR